MSRESDLIREVDGGLAVVTLNRPEALNALTLDQLTRLHAWLSAWREDPAVRAVAVRGAGGRAFAAGGDVRAVYEHRGDPAFMREVYRIEYLVDRMIHRYPKPYVALMDGVVMGGGCGISVHGSHRVVTEATVLAMPETAIGLFPDVAGCHFLGRCPGRIGEYLGLTGARLGAADAIHTGLADHRVAREDLDALIAAIRERGDVDAAIASLARDPGEPKLPAIREAIDRCFAGDTVLDIVAALEDEGGSWAEETREHLLRMCPFSLVVTLRAIRLARDLTMEQCLTMDYRLVQRFMHRDDYFEGVRARLIDKGGAPRWQPATLDLVDPDEVEAYFRPLPEGDIDFAAD
jgi:enoyl-CoA hydratase